MFGYSSHETFSTLPFATIFPSQYPILHTNCVNSQALVFCFFTFYKFTDQDRLLQKYWNEWCHVMHSNVGAKERSLLLNQVNCSGETYQMANLTSYPSDAPTNEAWSLNNTLTLNQQRKPKTMTSTQNTRQTFFQCFRAGLHV